MFNKNYKMSEFSLYLMSNASTSTYTLNTLTRFKNQLPNKLDLQGSWEVCLDSIGFQTTFVNVKSPIDKDTPSIRIYKIRSVPNAANQRVKFKHTVYDYFMENRVYSDEELEDYFDKINQQTGLLVNYNNNQLTFKTNTEQAVFLLYLHHTFKECFGLTGKVIEEIQVNKRFISINGIVVIEEDSITFGEKFYVYKLSLQDCMSLHSTGRFYYCDRLEGEIIDRRFSEPNLIKVQTNIITPQILNNTYSRDLLVFSPTFTKSTNYYYKHFNKQYIPISNTSIQNIGIKLVDENNQYLQLSAGHATIVRLNFRKMKSGGEKFYVRVTSDKNNEFPNNKNYKFKVRLPQTLYLSNNWKVSLASINYANTFGTFLHEEAERIFVIRDYSNCEHPSQPPEDYVYTFIGENRIYDVNDIITELNDKFLKLKKLGSAELTNKNRLKINLKLTTALIVMSESVAGILGYNVDFSNNQPQTYTITFADTTLMKGEIDRNELGEYTYTFPNIVNVTYLHPNYMVLYSSIVKETIIGETYAKILRIIPIDDDSTSNKIKEFKHQEYYDLQNTDITEIEFQLRTHDGKYVNFATKEHVILNLVFSSYQSDV